MSEKHIQRPLRVSKPGKPHGDMYTIIEPTDFRVASINPFAASFGDERDKFVAELFVKCVNEYPDMAAEIERLMAAAEMDAFEVDRLTAQDDARIAEIGALTGVNDFLTAQIKRLRKSGLLTLKTADEITEADPPESSSASLIRLLFKIEVSRTILAETKPETEESA